MFNQWYEFVNLMNHRNTAITSSQLKSNATKKYESFEQWYLNENTISQMLRQIPEGVYKQIRISIDSTLNQGAFVIQEERLEWLKKWMAYDIWLTIDKKFPTLKKNPNDLGTFSSLTYDISSATRDLISHINYDLRAYISHLLSNRPDIAKSKFNNIQYSLDQIEQESNVWHEELALQKRKSALAGRRIETPGMPEGYYWVSLDRNYCDLE